MGTTLVGILAPASNVKAPSAGVHGDSANQPGVVGTSQNSYGVMGITAQGAPFFPPISGVFGEGPVVGVVGVTTGPLTDSTGSNRGVLGIDQTGGATGVEGDSSGTGTGVLGTSISGLGVAGESNSGIGVGAGSLIGIAVQGASGVGPSIQGICHPSFVPLSLPPEGGIGVQGVSTQNAGIGVQGACGLNNEGLPLSGGIGVQGICQQNSGIGVQGMCTSGTSGVGVSGSGTGSNVGVLGVSDTSAGVEGIGIEGPAIFGVAESLDQIAGKFLGNVSISGSLSKGGGGFTIDHPLNPASQYLRHSFVESPEMKNVYDGIVSCDPQGEGVVELPSWFEALNSDFRYQLTAIGAPGPNLFIAEKISNGCFRIGGGTLGLEVSWQVTGIRQDAWATANRILIEEGKAESDTGRYLHPGLFGQPPELDINYALRSQAQQLLTKSLGDKKNLASLEYSENLKTTLESTRKKLEQLKRKRP